MPPRTLVTAIFDALAGFAATASRQSAAFTNTASNEPHNQRPLSELQNPLKVFASDSQARGIFLTLHLLFPTCVLPALDLLDRGLVSRLSVRYDEPSDTYTDQHNESTHPAVADNVDSSVTATATHRYIVRTTQPPTSAGTRFAAHRADDAFGPGSIAARLHETYNSHSREPRATGLDAGHGEAGGRSYLVDVADWSCDCAGFVFALFPASRDPVGDSGAEQGGAAPIGSSTGTASAVSKPLPAGGGAGDEHGGAEMEAARERRLMPAATLRGDDVPMCKHLLAAALVETCPQMFGHMAAEKFVSIAEWAALTAGWAA